LGLVILSPLAFVSYILPATKKYGNNGGLSLLTGQLLEYQLVSFFIFQNKLLKKLMIFLIGAPTSETVGAASVPLQYMVPLYSCF